MRTLKQRDRGRTFPGCGARSFLNAHHIVWWGQGGPTNLDNLTLCCHFHHKLVHEGGWDVRLNDDGTTTWIRPGRRELDPRGRRHRGDADPLRFLRFERRKQNHLS
jgi:HNH endonuclease